MAERLRTHTWLFAACLALALLIANVVGRADLRRAGQLARPAGGAGAVRDRRDGLDARDPLRRRRPRHLDRADRRARQRRPDRVAARARRRGQRLAGDPDRGPARRRHRRAQRRPGGRLPLPVGDRHAVHVLRAGGRHRQDRAGAEDRAGRHVAHRPRRHGRAGPRRAAARSPLRWSSGGCCRGRRSTATSTPSAATTRRPSAPASTSPPCACSPTASAGPSPPSAASP